MSCTLDKACRLNNEGIKLITEKRFEGATRLISRALAIVKDMISVLEESLDDEGEAILSCETPCYHFVQAPQDCTKVQRKNPITGMTSFIYSCPIRFILGASHAFSSRYLISVSFILLYNLALSNHMSACDGVLSLERLEKAISLYELSYTLYMREDINISTLHYMAIFNNLGHTHDVAGHPDKARYYFEQVLSIIMILNDCGQSELVDELEGFLDNVLAIVLSDGAAAPAA